jgi:hypothetical protein
MGGDVMFPIALTQAQFRARCVECFQCGRVNAIGNITSPPITWDKSGGVFVQNRGKTATK